jgi:hypothetical protein
MTTAPSANAICVSLSEVIEQLGESAMAYRATPPHILHHATAFAWRVNPDNARGVTYAFGVVRKKIVSAYRVEVAADRWPVMPPGSAHHTVGRRVIPLTEVSEAHWNTAVSLFEIEMFGGVRYAHLDVAADGRWISLKPIESSPVLEEEQSI